MSTLKPETPESAELAAEVIIATLGCYVPGGWAHPGDEAARLVTDTIRQREIAALEEAARAMCPDYCGGRIKGRAMRLVSPQVWGRGNNWGHMTVTRENGYGVDCPASPIYAFIEKRKEGR